MKFDLAVAWRVYPGISKQPLIHANDKLQLVRTCLASFLQSVGDLKVKYYLILDGCPPVYEAMIETLFAHQAYTAVRTDAIGNHRTFALQIDLLTQQQEAELVYFAEDDYLYAPHAMKKMVTLMRTGKKVDFATVFYSKDIVQHPIHDHRHSIQWNADTLWMSDSSTCLTFLTRKTTLLATKDLLLTYCRGNNDCAIWLILTRTHIYNPFKYLRFALAQDKESWNILKMAVKYSFKYFFGLQRYRLWVAWPGIGTHLETPTVMEAPKWIALGKQFSS
ncbi:hypothetical protein [Paraflavitalea pollutisoli]|uniref:hypothetical protein n=1 Tax=Paraflavitalea pollutisoli TaxID=3034143 RepID=UPI0023EDF44C|nr:hypothetical protein [Paraflavitalea sp. H1-2-19X]